MAVSDGLVATAVIFYLTPIVCIAFLLGSLALGAPAYLVLRKSGRTGPIPLAVTGALLSGGVAWAMFGAYSAMMFVPPVAASGAIGALVFHAFVPRQS